MDSALRALLGQRFWVKPWTLLLGTHLLELSQEQGRMPRRVRRQHLRPVKFSLDFWEIG